MSAPPFPGKRVTWWGTANYPRERQKHSSKLGSATPPKLGSKPIDKGGGEMAILNLYFALYKMNREKAKMLFLWQN